MMSKERKLLLAINITPIIIIIIFSVFVTVLSLIQNNINFEHKIQQLENEMTSLVKNRTKEEVMRLYNNIKFEKTHSEDILKKNIRQRVYEAHSIITNIYNENKDKESLIVKKMIKDALRKIRFHNNRGYYFIYEMTGKNVLLPANKELEGKNFWNWKDAKEVYTIQEMSNIVEKDNEGFLSWWWYRPGDTQKQYKKIGFSKYFKPFNWFIGTGEYVQDFEEELQTKILQNIENLSYGKNSYFFIHKYDGFTISHIKDELVGINNLKKTDANGSMIIENIIKKAKEGGGFIHYVSLNNPKTGKSEKKISYIKGFDDWKWAIGSGAYLSDVKILIEMKKKEFKELKNLELQKILFLSLVLTSVFIVLSYLLSKKIRGVFLDYKNRVKEEVSNNKKKDIQIMEQSKLASMGEMIGHIAHQWRQPLSAISTAATGMKLQKEYGLLSDDSFNISCDAINDNAQYLSVTIDDFKNFIKGDRAKSIFNLESEINRFLHLVDGTVKNHNIIIIQNIEKDILINGYKNELIQCLINIFNNAKDALIMKNLNSNDNLLFITALIEKNNVIIEIKDNGGGIPSDIISNIFEPYFTTKHQSQGTGLGLHMTYNLITDGMKGTIKAKNIQFQYENKKYQGAQFSIIIPLS